jgi:hypothetical protein
VSDVEREQHSPLSKQRTVANFSGSGGTGVELHAASDTVAVQVSAHTRPSAS